jgi:hypothetical protein
MYFSCMVLATKIRCYAQGRIFNQYSIEFEIKPEKGQKGRNGDQSPDVMCMARIP